MLAKKAVTMCEPNNAFTPTIETYKKKRKNTFGIKEYFHVFDHFDTNILGFFVYNYFLHISIMF